MKTQYFIESKSPSSDEFDALCEKILSHEVKIQFFEKNFSELLQEFKINSPTQTFQQISQADLNTLHILGFNFQNVRQLPCLGITPTSSVPTQGRVETNSALLQPDFKFETPDPLEINSTQEKASSAQTETDKDIPQRKRNPFSQYGENDQLQQANQSNQNIQLRPRARMKKKEGFNFTPILILLVFIMLCGIGYLCIDDYHHNVVPAHKAEANMLLNQPAFFLKGYLFQDRIKTQADTLFQPKLASSASAEQSEDSHDFQHLNLAYFLKYNPLSHLASKYQMLSSTLFYPDHEPRHTPYFEFLLQHSRHFFSLSNHLFDFFNKINYLS